MIVVPVRDESEFGALLFEGKSLVVAVALEKRPGRPVGRAEDERSVVPGDLRRDGIGKPGPGLVPGVIGDFGKDDLLPRRELPDDKIGPGLFLLFLLLSLFFLSFFGLFLGLRGVLLLVRLLFGGLREPGDERPSVLGDLEALDPVEGLHGAGGQVHDPEAGLGHFLGFLLGLFRLIDVRLEGRDREGHGLPVGRDHGALAPGSAVFDARAQVPDDELTVPVLRIQDIDEPRAVPRKGGPADGAPGIVRVVSQGLLSRDRLSGGQGQGRNAGHEHDKEKGHPTSAIRS